MLFSLLNSCMRSVHLGDPELKPFDAMFSVNREQYGLTPLPKTGLVFIEGKSLHGDYDAMLHFMGNPGRTIAFRWDGKAYQWLGEQENFDGPGTYETPDGSFHEHVAIGYYQEAGFGTPKGLTLLYVGHDGIQQGANANGKLTLGEVKALLRGWGFRY